MTTEHLTPNNNLAHAFYRHFIKRNDDECWLWFGANNGTGYGHLNVDGVDYYAHRVAWMLVHGEIPKHLFVLHRCDTPSCVNHHHLFLGTHTTNMRDMNAKKRRGIRTPYNQNGSNNHSAKLTESHVLDIRKRIEVDKESFSSIGRHYNVSYQTISNIAHNKSWSK